MQQAHHFLLNLPVQNSNAVSEFFNRLAFTELYPPLENNTRLFSDGHLQVQLSPAEGWRKALLLYTEQPLDSLAAELQLTGVQTVVQDTKIQQISPDGLAVYWVQQPAYEFPKQPVAGKTLSGSFFEISMESKDLGNSRLFWESLGFRKTLPEGDLSNWLSLTNGLLTVGLYQEGSCPHPFHSPAITFFNTDAPERLLGLQEAGFSLAHMVPSESSEPEEAILESPEGHHLFMFKA